MIKKKSSKFLFYVPPVELTAVCISVVVHTKNAKQDVNAVWLRKKMLQTF